MEWAAITALCAICTLASAGVSAGGTYFFTKGKNETTAMIAAGSAERLAQASLAKIELMAMNLHQHEIEDAKSFAELRALVGEASRATTAAETRLAKALDDVRESIDKMGERFDRFLSGSRPA